jgi:hypothetical protein
MYLLSDLLAFQLMLAFKLHCQLIIRSKPFLINLLDSNMFEVGLPFKNGKEIILVGKSKQVLMVTT